MERPMRPQPAPMPTAARPTTPVRRRGFTLLELVMVTMIIAILASIAMPRFADSIARQRVEAAIRTTSMHHLVIKLRARKFK